MSSAFEDESTPPSKRRKTQLACTVCRARKTACTAERPHCTSCVARGWQARCSYQDKPVQSPAITLLDIEQRLQRLEDGQLSKLSSSQSVVTPTASDAAQLYGNLPTEHPRPGPNRPQSLHGEYGDAVQGISSNERFVREVTAVTTHAGRPERSGLDNSASDSPAALVAGIFASHVPRSAVPGHDLRDLVLPPRELADELLEWYWGFIHPLSPVLHKPSFIAQYQSLWEPPVPGYRHTAFDNAVLYATLNMALALGCQRNEGYGVDERQSLGEEFYHRSRTLVPLETIDHYSLPVVQLLLLRGLYLLYSPYADRSWTMVGAAARAAQAIGLDTPRLHSTPVPQLTREMRRRVWYTCVMLDRVTANTFGRSLFLPQTNIVPFPSNIDDEHLSATQEDGKQPSDKPSFLEAFNLSLQVSSIGYKAQLLQEERALQGYKENSSIALGAVVSASGDLDIFTRDLPPHLKAGKSKVEPVFELQSNTLRARVMYMRLWLLRPFLLAEVKTYRAAGEVSGNENDSTATTSLERKLRDEICKQCVDTAHEVLRELHQALSHIQRTSPWHALFFTFAAASILVAASLCPQLEVDLDHDPARESWNRAIKLFRFHNRHLPSAEKGLEALWQFRKLITGEERDNAEALTGRLDESTPATEPTSFGSATAVEEISTDTLFSQDFTAWADPDSLDLSWLTSQDMVFDEWLIAPE